MAITLSIDNTFVNGVSTLDATTMNGNFTDVVTWSKTFATSTGYVFTTPAAGDVAVTINGLAGQSADLLDVNTKAVGGTKTFFLDSGGNATLYGSATFASSGAAGGAATVYVGNDAAATNGLNLNVPTSSTNGFRFLVNNVTKLTLDNTGALVGSLPFSSSGGAGTASTVYVGNDSVANAGMNINVPSSSTNGFRFLVNNSTVAQISNVGLITSGTGGIQSQPTINSTNTLSYVPPGYTAAGAALASTFHVVQGTFTGTGGVVTITLSGAAAFSSGTSYIGGYLEATVGGGMGGFVNTNGTSTATQASTTNGVTYSYFLIGT